MKYLIFLRDRIGGGRYTAYFNCGYFYLVTNEGSRAVHQNDVKRAYLKN